MLSAMKMRPKAWGVVHAGCAKGFATRSTARQRRALAGLLDAQRLKKGVLLAITRVSEKTCRVAASAQEPDQHSLLELRRKSASDLHRASVASFATCGCGVSLKMSALRLCLPGTG